MTDSLLGKYLGCILCGCKFVSNPNQFDTNCPICFSSVALLSEIQSQNVYDVLKKHGEVYPKSEDTSALSEWEFPSFGED